MKKTAERIPYGNADNQNSRKSDNGTDAMRRVSTYVIAFVAATFCAIVPVQAHVDGVTAVEMRMHDFGYTWREYDPLPWTQYLFPNNVAFCGLKKDNDGGESPFETPPMLPHSAGEEDGYFISIRPKTDLPVGVYTDSLEICGAGGSKLWIALCFEVKEYMNPQIMRQVTLPEVEGASSRPSEGVHYVKSRENFTFTLTPHEGYTLEHLTVKTNTWRDLEPGGVTLTPNGDGSLTVTIRYVNSSIHLDVSAAVPLSNASVATTDVWAHGGRLYIAASQSGTAHIYNVTGTRTKAVHCTAGQTESVSLPAGAYIVQAGGKTYKVFVQ